jgi:hypothetical protein
MFHEVTQEELFDILQKHVGKSAGE